MKISKRLALPALASILVPTGIQAAALRISPIGVDIPSNERAAAVTIFNNDSEPVELQVRMFKWSQTGGDDHLDAANDIFVSPPALKIPPKKSFTIRIARPATSEVGGEISYRLFIDELPKPVDPRTVAQGVRMVLRTSMPVFVVDKTAMAKLTWHVWQDKTGLHAEATNSGRRHAKIGGLQLELPNGKPIVFTQGLAGYVLAGSTKRFDYRAPSGDPVHLAAGTKVTVTAKNDLLDVKEAVDVEAR